MVGAPKNISDLDKLDANPVAECRRCVWTCEFDRGALIRVRIKAGLSTTWDAFCAETRCERCGGPVAIRMRLFVSDTALRKGDLKQALVFKALCVLAEAQVHAAKGRVAPSLGLRFALAYLYAVGSRNREWFDREPYIDFWRAATKQDAVDGYTASVARGGQLSTSLNAIGRAAGMEITSDVLASLRKAANAIDTGPSTDE